MSDENISSDNNPSPNDSPSPRNLDDSTIISIFEANPELRWSVIINAYQRGRISLSRVAELLNLHILELRDQLLEMGLKVSDPDLAPQNDDEASSLDDSRETNGE